MKHVTKTATQARQEFFDLINAAYYKGQITYITKRGKVVAMITPPDYDKPEPWLNPILSPHFSLTFLSPFHDS